MATNHMVTIPKAPFEAAELDVGDRFRVEAEAKGRVVITRVEEYMELYTAQLELQPDPDDADTNN